MAPFSLAVDVVFAEPRKIDVNRTGILSLEIDVLWIVDGVGKALERSLGRRSLESPVRVLEEGAVDERQVLGTNEWLCSFDDAIDEGQVFGIPGNVLAFQMAVLDGDVVTVPKGVLGIETAVLDDDIVAVLERILSNHVEVLYRAMGTLKEGVVAFEDETINLESSNLPERFDSVETRVLDGDVVAFAQGLRRGHSAIPEGTVFHIPERRPIGVGKGAAIDEEVLVFPESVAGLDVATVADDVGAFLDWAFARAIECAALEDDAVLTEDFSLLVSFVSDDCPSDMVLKVVLGFFD